MKRSIIRTSIIVVLLIALVTLTMTSFAYWDKLTHTSDSQIVNIGEGTSISVNVDTETSTLKLIPEGKVKAEGDTYSIVYEYTAALSKKPINDLYLSVNVENKKIDGSTAFAHLANVAVVKDMGGMINDTGTLVTVTVTLSNPTSQEAYDAIKNKSITFDLVFSASQTPPQSND